ncbi:MAG: alkaline phosphatase family protein [Streptosporangiales bacterium]|nr:alkaline phosphatase family protein [Streptosporangiales bacterium]
MPRLVVGPLLRHVDTTTATVWVETDAPCTVRVLDATARTFTVHGHHYGIVDVGGLTPGTSTEYAVTLDDETVWPEPDSSFPPPRIRTQAHEGGVRLVFGSCRMSVPHDAEHTRTYGVDVLRAYAHRLARQDDAEWPTVLLLVGDQVYADETSQAMQEFIRSRRDIARPPGIEVADFEEYTELYRLAWTDPSVRWLLSTVSTAMIFDDHDIRDDWNTSWTWRRQMDSTPWWRTRITGGLAAYWLYQHLGNLGPGDRAADATYTAVRSAADDAGGLVDEFAYDAHRSPRSAQWSYARTFGTVTLLVVDSRCGRVLDPTHRAMVDDAEWSWIERTVEAAAGQDHLLIGTSLPYLLPRGVHHLEAWDEAVAGGVWGRRAARFGERVRRGLDLEHWAAFGESHRAMSELITSVATGARGPAPATIAFLSGDVHYSYAATASYEGQDATTSRVHQLVCSPIRNPLSPTMRYLNGIASFGVAELAGTVLAKLARVRPPDWDWKVSSGPHFHNALATVDIDGRDARLRWETATANADESRGLTETASLPL